MAKKKTSKKKASSVGGNDKSGVAARRVALTALLRIEKDGAYSNLVLPEILDRSDLSSEDKRFVTEMVYGTTRMRRACDFLVDRYLLGEADHQVRSALRLGAYQLYFMRTPAHAAVDATVSAVKGRGGSLVNAVLRKVAAENNVVLPSLGVELSYPDWIVDLLISDLGKDDAHASLRAMNEPASTSIRDDGYVQDPASQQVVEIVDARPGELIVDLCAAPGGKATGLAASGAFVVASDLRKNRSRLIARNVAKLDSDVQPLNADGTKPPFRRACVDKVLIDAPCSGLGSLRRRADARWRIDEQAPKRLAALQTDLVLAGLELLRPGGVLTYSVCTLALVEGAGVLRQVMANHTGLEIVTSVPESWQVTEGVGRLLPAETDGMMLWQVRVRPDVTAPLPLEATQPETYEIIKCWT